MRALKIMTMGIVIIFIGTVIFNFVTLLNHWDILITNQLLILTSLLCQMCIMIGFCMATSNALALALLEYKDCIGAASSLFGFYYYSWICLFTFGMSLSHNGSCLAMPLYFMSLSIGLLLARILITL